MSKRMGEFADRVIAEVEEAGIDNEHADAVIPLEERRLVGETVTQHLVHEAYESLLRKAAEWDDTDWESAPKFERHAVNAALDLRDVREQLTSWKGRFQQMLNKWTLAEASLREAREAWKQLVELGVIGNNRSEQYEAVQRMMAALSVPVEAIKE